MQKKQSGNGSFDQSHLVLAFAFQDMIWVSDKPKSLAYVESGDEEFADTTSYSRVIFSMGVLCIFLNSSNFSKFRMICIYCSVDLIYCPVYHHMQTQGQSKEHR